MLNPLNLPFITFFTFLLVVMCTLFYVFWILKKAFSKENPFFGNQIFIGVFLWLILQVVLVLNDVYNANLNALPPRIMLFGIFPTILMLFWVLLSKKGNYFLDKVSTIEILQHLMLLHIIRVPVELVLDWLAWSKVVPFLMTFEGQNFDILAGITAPFVVYLVFFAKKSQQKTNYKLLLCWNILAIILLANIVFCATFSAPAPFQMFAFDQPNIAILYFPVSLLPTFIVPVVIFSHIIVMRKCVKEIFYQK
jgi:hypothetical protein